MKKVGKTTGLALLLIVLAGIVQPSYPSPGVTHAFDFELEPISQLKKDTPLTMKLTFSPRYPWCKKVSITLSALNYVEKFSERSWEVELQDDQPYSTTFQVSIPDDDTCAVHVTLECGWLRETIKRFFVTTGDKVEYWKGDPRDYHPSPPPSKTNDPIRDTLTEEHLQTEYEVLLDLRDSTHLKFAEEILGPMSGSGKYKSCNACYILNVSLENLFKLGDEGIEIEFTAPPPWSRRYRAPKDSVPQPLPPPSPEADERVVFFTLEPVEHPDSAGPVDMKFGFTIEDDFCTYCKCCNEIDVEVITKNGLEYHGEKSWIAHPNPDKEHSFSTILPITLPPDDTSSLRIVLKFKGQGIAPAHVYFVTTGDSVEFWKGPPFKSYWDIPLPEPDTTRYEVKIDLRNPRRLKLIMQFEKEFGPITETADSGFYIIRSTRDAVDMLRREGFKCEYLKEPSPRKPGRPGLKSTSKQPKKQKTRHPHPKPDKKNDGQIWLDCVDGEDEWGRLYANQLIRFILGFANHYGDDVHGIANGFRIYSPDGASWDTTVPETLPTLAWEDAFDSYFGIFYKSLTGSGADSIKFLGITWLGGGLPNGFDDTAIAFAIGPIDPEDVGKTICIDSSYVSGTDNWSWSSSSGDSSWHPTWYGPSCFEITGPGQIYFSGRLRYMDPVPPDTTLESIRGATIYMWDADFFGYQFLDSAVTDNSGYFYIGPVTNHDDNGWAGQDVFFSFYAMNEGAYVTDSLNGPVYMVVSDTTDNIAAGDHVYNRDLLLNESKAFFVADAILDGYKRWKQIRPDPSDHPWGPVQVVLNKGSENAHYNKADQYIYLNDSVDASHRWPDTWNKSTILHEHGHRLAHMLLFLRHGGGSHSLRDFTSLGTASSEGWAHFWSAFVLDTCIRVRYWNDFYDSSWFSLEDGEFDLVPYIGSANAMGKYNEGATAGIFCDIYDENDDDYSDVNDWGTLNLGPHPDGVGDSLSNGIDNILITLLDSAALGHRPDNIDEFWYTWRYPPSFGHIKAMVNIWYEHGEGCCVGIRGNVDYDLLDEVNMADITWLVDYLFRSGPPPPCTEEANVDGDAGENVNVADLTYLVDYLLRGGPPPPPCP